MKQPEQQVHQQKKPQSIEEIKSELIVIRHSRKNEAGRQLLRKVLSPSSRFLDNNYNPILHQKTWKPNGCMIEKKKYNYSETGLTHFYSKNNVLQKLDLETKQKQKTQYEKNFLEFEYMEEGDMVITIEHCANCEDHKTHTQHINEIYPRFAKILQKCILIRFPYIKVYLKPIETDIIQNKESSVKNNKILIIDEKYKEVRIGAFEVHMGVKRDNKVDINLIHSKIKSGHWPSISKVLNKIVNFIPRCNLTLRIYDREEGLTQEEEEKDDFVFSKYENIKVNVYLLNNAQIKELSEIANEELGSIINPKKRKILITQLRQIQKESYNKSFFSNTSKNTETQHAYSNSLTGMTLNNLNMTRPDSSLRPFSGRSTSNSIYFNNNNKSISTRLSSANRNLNLRPLSTVTNFSTKYTNIASYKNQTENIEDKDLIDSLKGMFISQFSTDKNGKISIQNYPCDTYLIEVEDSKNFFGCASVVKFNNLPHLKENSQNNLTLQKFYGLRRQTHAHVEFYIYVEKNDKENKKFDLITISGAEVILRRCTENIIDNAFFDDENRIVIPENKVIKSRHDVVTIPGKYIVEVNRKGYDYARQEVEILAGENKFNIKLHEEKKFKICVTVFNYETKTPIENANLKINYSKYDATVEGLTDNAGSFIWDTVKNDDFVTIFVNKEGYMPCQRTFVKDVIGGKIERDDNRKMQGDNTNTGVVEKTWKTENPSNSLEKDVFIYLVKDNLIFEEKNFLLVIYSNFFEENFDSNFLMSKQMEGLININYENMQRSKGISNYLFNKKDNFDEFNFNEESETEEYHEIIRLVLKIKNPNLLKTYEINSKSTLNGLQKYSCEACLYCPNGNIFFIQSPQFSRQEKYNLWDLGFLDIKSGLFYEMSLLINNSIEKNIFFTDWLQFLQLIIDKQIYKNLFETLQFDKGILSQSDRLEYEAAFIRAVKTLTNEEENALSVDFLIYLCDLMKNNFGLVSYIILRNKIASNLRNFKYQV